MDCTDLFLFCTLLQLNAIKCIFTRDVVREKSQTQHQISVKNLIVQAVRYAGSKKTKKTHQRCCLCYRMTKTRTFSGLLQLPKYWSLLSLFVPYCQLHVSVSLTLTDCVLKNIITHCPIRQWLGQFFTLLSTASWQFSWKKENKMPQNIKKRKGNVKISRYRSTLYCRY